MLQMTFPWSILYLQFGVCVTCSFAQVPDQPKRDELANLFGLTDEDKLDIAANTDKQADRAQQEQEEEVFF